MGMPERIMRMAVSERQSGQRLVGIGKRYGGALTVIRGSVGGGL